MDSPASPVNRTPDSGRSGSVARTDGYEVECLVEIPRAQGEVTAVDRRREAVVEALGDAEALVDPVPAQFQRVLVEPEAKLIKSALRNPDLLAERLGFGPPSLRYVPREEAERYAVLDAEITLRLREVL